MKIKTVGDARLLIDAGEVKRVSLWLKPDPGCCGQTLNVTSDLLRQVLNPFPADYELARCELSDGHLKVMYIVIWEKEI